MVRKQIQRKCGERAMLNLIASLPKPLDRFLDKFDHLLSKPQFAQFKRYVSGLFLELKRTNLQTIDASHVESYYNRLHHYLSESNWDPLKINSYRLKELHRSRQTKSCHKGALVIDDTDNLKTGEKTEGAKVQYAGSQGRPANCNIAVTSHYIDQVKDFPVDLEPYVPADEFPDGKDDPDFRSKLQLAKGLVKKALQEGISFSEVVFDSWYSSKELIEYLEEEGLTWITELKRNRRVRYRGEWVRVDELVTLIDDEDFVAVPSLTKDGKQEFLWGTKSRIKRLSGEKRIVIIKPDRATKNMKEIKVLATNAIDYQDKKIRKRYSLRHKIEGFYRTIKDDLSFDQYQVRGLEGIRRHWYLVFLAYTFLIFSKLKGSFSKLVKKPLKTIGDLVRVVRELNFLSFQRWWRENADRNVLDQCLTVIDPHFA